MAKSYKLKYEPNKFITLKNNEKTTYLKFRFGTNYHIYMLIIMMKMKMMWMEKREVPGRQTHYEEQHMNYGYRRFHREEGIQVGFQ